MNTFRFLAAFVLGLSASTAFAQVPPLLNYQGRVTVGSTNFDGTGAFKFALVNSNGSVSFWSNDGTSSGGSQPSAAVSLPVVKGLYSVLLGDTTIGGMPTALPATVFTNFDVRLRVWFNDGVTGFQQFTPDQRIAAVGYALMGANVPDGSITSNKIADGAVTGPKLANNAVTVGKIAGGAIYGTNLVGGTITSNQLASSQSLGSSLVNGQLDIYRTSAGTPAISLLGSGSQISTYGSDGLEQTRLWGPSYGELLLNNGLANNATAVRLTAQASTGGQLELRNTNGATRALLEGENTGGALTLYQIDGGIGVFLDGDDGGGGSISVRNTNASTRAFIDGHGNNGGGQITVYAYDGDTGAVLYGDSGGAGLLNVFNTNGNTRASVDGLGNNGGGQMTLYANDGSTTVALYGDSTTAVGGGELSVRGPTGVTAAQLVGYSSGGRLITQDESSADTVLIGSSSGTGGFAYFYKANGSIGVDVDGEDANAGRITIFGTNGSSVITLDGNSSGDGRIICDVLQINGGSDLSEKFDITSVHSAVQPGMIVSINPDKPGDLVVSQKPYDRTVAGVISGAGGVKPGMLMGQAGTKADGKYPVALTGRVYCYVDTDAGGAIEPGDLITTSNTPGHGMKVTDPGPAAGAIIGKAMSKLARGKGLVLVLVSLQ